MRTRHVAACLLAGAAVFPAAGDTLITTRITGEAIPATGQPARNEVTRLWIGPSSLRHDQDVGLTLLDFAADKLYVVKPGARQYHEFSLPFDYAALYSSDQRARIEEGRRKLEFDVSVRATGETRRVLSYVARKHHVVLTNEMGMHLEIDYWTTPDIGVDLARYKHYAATVAEFMPMGGAWVERLNEIEGYPVLKVTTTYIGANPYVTSEEIEAVESRDVPAGFYEVPAGHVLEPWGPTARSAAAAR